MADPLETQGETTAAPAVESDGAHAAPEVVEVDVDVLAAFASGGKVKRTVDPAALSYCTARLTEPGDKVIVLPPHARADSTGATLLREALGEAYGLTPNHFTVVEREVRGEWYWQVEYRVTPTVSKRKAAPVQAPAEVVAEVAPAQ